MQKIFGPVSQTPSSNFSVTEADLAKREGILEERERILAEKMHLAEDKLAIKL